MNNMGTILKVNKSDIYGAIEGFPLEVVQKMIDLTIKEEHTDVEGALKILCKTPWNGFTWTKTDEGSYFWYKVVGHHEWWRFFKRYPVNLLSPIRYAVVKECNDGFPEEIVGCLGGSTQLSGKGKSGDIYFIFPSIDGFRVGFAIKGSPRYKRIIKNGIEL